MPQQHGRLVLCMCPSQPNLTPYMASGQTVSPPLDAVCMDTTVDGHFNYLLVYYTDTASTGPNITDQTYVDQSFINTTLMLQNFLQADDWLWKEFFNWYIAPLKLVRHSL